MASEPKWRRRSAERPGEIAEAAQAMFAERGFAAARLSDIAERAGVSKAALYRYYPTKVDLFRAVLAERSRPNVEGITALASAVDLPFPVVVDAVLGRLGETVSRPELRALARMVIAESGNFPELARLWHDAVVSPALGAVSRLIARAQDRGEARAGDPRLMAMGLVGPMLLGAIWREVMEPAGGAALDLHALAAEHRRTVIEGMAVRRD